MANKPKRNAKQNVRRGCPEFKVLEREMKQYKLRFEASLATSLVVSNGNPKICQASGEMVTPAYNSAEKLKDRQGAYPTQCQRKGSGSLYISVLTHGL
jgi:hypothetical protein